MNVFKKLAFALNFTILLGGCSNKSEHFYDGKIEGAYFITEESYKNYVTHIAQSKGEDNNWIKSVLDGGDGGQWSYLIRPREYFYCIIVNGQINMSHVNENVYYFTLEDGIYKGVSLNEQISFYNDENILHVKKGNITFDYEKDYDYVRKEDGDSILDTPNGFEYSSDETKAYFAIACGQNYGDIGLTADIKIAGQNEFLSTKIIERPYLNSYHFEFDINELAVGENFIRFYSLGSPTITNEKYIVLYKSSEFTIFKITLTEDKTLKIEQL